MSYCEFVEPGWQPALRDAGLGSLRDLLLDERPDTRGEWTALSKPGLGGRRRWRWALPDGRVLYVKRYADTPLREQFDRINRQSARHSRAWWEWRVGQELADAHIPAVRAVGWCEQMRGAFESASAVLLEAAAGEPLDRALKRLLAADAAQVRGAARHELARRLARFVAAFHQTGFLHRDLYLCHIFVVLDEDRAAPQFTLIDLARLHRPRVRRMRWLLKDLGQLDSAARALPITRGDRHRFLLAYLGLLPGAPRTRWYARAILRRSDRIVARVLRKASAAAARA